MAEEGAEISSKDVETEVSREASSKEVFRKKKGEIVGRVKSGEDEEGSLLRGLFIEAVESSSEALGAVSVTYNQAQESAKKIDRAGEANKLQSSLKTLYRQTALGEYEIIVPKSTPEARQQLIRGRLLQDLRDFPDRMADYYMRDYYDQKARTEIEADKVRDLVSKDNLSRRDLRMASYRLDREEGKLLVLEDETLTRVSRTDVLSNILESHVKRMSYRPKEHKKLEDRGEEERNRLIEQRVKKFEEEILEEQGEGKASAFEHLDDNEKNRLVSKLLEVEMKRENLRVNLEDSVSTGDAEEICSLASKIKLAQLERQGVLVEMSVVIADQRVSDSLDKFKDAGAGVGKSIRESKNPVQAASRFVSSFKDLVSTRLGAGGEAVLEKMRPVLDGLSKAKGDIEELAGKALNELDKIYEKTGRRFVSRARRSIDRIPSRVSQEYSRVRSDFERRQIDIRREYYVQRHGLDVAWRQAVIAVVNEGVAARKRAGLAIEQVFGPTELTPEELSAERKEFYRGQKKRFKKAVRDNPRLRRFDEELMRGVREKHTRLEFPIVPLKYSPGSEIVEKVEGEIVWDDEDEDEEEQEAFRDYELTELEETLINDIEKAKGDVESTGEDYDKFEAGKYKSYWEIAQSQLLDKLSTFHGYLNRQLNLDGLGEELEDDVDLSQFKKLNSDWNELEKEIRKATVEERNRFIEQLEEIAMGQWDIYKRIKIK